MSYQAKVQNGSKVVVISANDETGPFRANLYVNCTDTQLGDITLIGRKFQSLKGAQQFAAKAVA